MKVTAISFGYSNRLKTLWKNGELPTVTKGLYGGTLTKDTISLEHLKPHSQGGSTTMYNLALATVENNQKRANKPLQDFLTKENLENYLKQFEGIKLKKFDGDRYIEQILKTLKRLNIEV